MIHTHYNANSGDTGPSPNLLGLETSQRLVVDAYQGNLQAPGTPMFDQSTQSQNQRNTNSAEDLHQRRKPEIDTNLSRRSESNEPRLQL